MKKNKWKLVLVKDSGNIIVDSFNSKELAEEELKYRNSLSIAMGYAPDVPYQIRKIN